MASCDFFSIKFQSKFDGLNSPIWRVKMTLFFESLGFRVAKVMNKEFIEPQGDEDTWCKSIVKDYKANAKEQYLTQALNDDDYLGLSIVRPLLKYGMI